jgi:hypothetical protein
MVIHQSACAAVRITVRIFIERLLTRSSRESGRSVDAPNNSLEQTSLRSRLKPTLSVCFRRFGMAALRNPERPLRVELDRRWKVFQLKRALLVRSNPDYDG